jgi:very-short-patch-repair endonuclease
MHEAQPLPPKLRSRAFSVSEALGASVRPGRLRAGDLRAPFRGVREPADTEITLLSRCAAMNTRMPTGGAFSHTTAAILLGLPLPLRLARAETLHLSVARPRRTPRIRGVVGHQLTLRDGDGDGNGNGDGDGGGDGDVVTAAGFRVTSPVRTWCDLAPHLSISESVAVGDAIVHWRTPRASVADLVSAAAALRGRPGASVALAASGLLHERAESPQESELRVMLQGGLPRLDVNVDLHDVHGGFVARPDLRFPDFRVIVEYEGDHHRTARRQWRRDLKRTIELQGMGETVLRLGADDLRPSVVEVVGSVLRQRGWVPFATRRGYPGRVESS